MARMNKEERLAAVHDEALRLFDEVQGSCRDERLQCLQDRRFYSIAGGQWEGNLGAMFENKPRFEVNKIHLAVIRIINEYRNNRVTVDFISKDGAKNDKLAGVCDGLYRADEQDSNANEAYDNAFEEAVGGGFGAWRLISKYEDEEDPEDERQRICIEPIFDADSSVFFDANAKRQDKADAKRCWVITAMSREAYVEAYDDDPASWPKTIQRVMFDWSTPDVVYVAEYYVVEHKTENILIYRNVAGEEERYSEQELEDNPEMAAELEAVGSQLVRTKKCKIPKVHKYILSGGGVLEDCGYIAGKCIPIIPVYGKRWFVDNVERCMGHVRLAKDSQRLKNMQLSKLGEIAATSSVEKPIFTPEQIAGHQVMWAEDNIKQYPYMLVNPVMDANGNMAASGPIGYTKSPNLPPALAAMLQLTETDMQEILGSQADGDKIVSNISGKAVEMVQQRLDMQTFIYMSNFAKAMKRCGEVWLSMAKDLYNEEGRKMKTINEANDTESIELMQPMMGANGYEVANDLSQAKFDVAVDVGPSSSSKRAATVRAITGMMAITNDQETSQVLQAMAMMNMEGEGVEDARDFFRKRLVRMGVVKPTEQEAQELAAEAANQKPSSQDQLMQAMAQEAGAKASKAQADTIKVQADAELARAKTLETVANIQIDSQDHAMRIAQQLGKVVQQQSANVQTPDTLPPIEPPAQAL